MPFHTFQVANYFINKSMEARQSITPMQLQKLVYFAHGWSLGLGRGPLIDEPVYAWKFGPVIDSIYHEFKAFGNNSIPEKASFLQRDDKSGRWVTITPEIPENDELTKLLLDAIWDKYGRLSGFTLSQLSHTPEGPWASVWNKSKDKFRDEIPQKDIQAYFENALNG